jgi:hypothetical protein
MPIRITDAETEKLIHEMAELEEVTPTQAIHKAVSQSLSGMSPTSREGESVKEVVAKREAIASIYAADSVLDGLIGDIGAQVWFLFLSLVFALIFPDLRRTALIVMLILVVTTVVWIERRLSRKSKVREKVRCSLQKEINAIEPSLPGELSFLSEGVEMVSIWGLTLPDDEK